MPFLILHLPLAILTFTEGCVFGAIIATFIVGSGFLIFRDWEKTRFMRLANEEYWCGRRDGRKEGREEAAEMAIREIASRPWQTEAPVHEVVSPDHATRKPAQN